MNDPGEAYASPQRNHKLTILEVLQISCKIYIISRDLTKSNCDFYTERCACQLNIFSDLKKTFSKAKKIAEISENFVMVNLQVREEFYLNFVNIVIRTFTV